MSKLTKVAAAGLAAASALAPMAVFAVDPVVGDVTTHTDNLSVTVGSICTLGLIDTDNINYATIDGATTDQTTHASGTYNTNIPTSHVAGVYGTWDSAEGDGKTLSGTIMPGTVSEDFGSSTFTIKCNNRTGYKLNAVGGTNASATTGATTALVNGKGDSINTIGSSAANLSADTSSWAFKVQATSSTIENGTITVASSANFMPVPAGKTVIAERASNTSLDDGDTIEVTYGVSIDAEQATGTYTGSVSYLLEANPEV